MQLLEKLQLIERLDHLIRMKATGCPGDLARRIGKSERSLYQLINLMKDLGAPINYCYRSQSYKYEYSVGFSFGFERKESLMGGMQSNN